MSRGSRAEDRRNKSAVRERGRISELKCLELSEGIVSEFAVMQQNLEQHLVKASLECRVISAGASAKVELAGYRGNTMIEGSGI